MPLWWDAGTLADVAAWKAQRVRQGAGDGEPFVCSLVPRAKGRAHVVSDYSSPRHVEASSHAGPMERRISISTRDRRAVGLHALLSGRECLNLAAAFQSQLKTIAGMQREPVLELWLETRVRQFQFKLSCQFGQN